MGVDESKFGTEEMHEVGLTRKKDTKRNWRIR